MDVSNKFKERSDIETFSLFRKGSKEAFDEIYNRYWEKLYNYSFYRLRSKDGAFEVVQNVFVSLWARRDNIDLVRSLSGYLFAAVRFQLIRHSRDTQIKEYYLQQYTHFSASFDNSNEETIEADDLQRALERGIAQLPNRCQQITRLCLLEHWTVQRVAATLNISQRTVENQLALGRKHLRVALADFTAAYFLFTLF